MLRYVMAALLAAAPVAAASAQPPAEGKWALAAMPNGCMVQAVSPHGTMLSVWGFAGDAKLGFLLQNRGWTVEDGAKTPLEVGFAGARSWPVEATARAHIDRDGPGLFFIVAGSMRCRGRERGTAPGRRGPGPFAVPPPGNGPHVAALEPGFPPSPGAPIPVSTLTRVLFPAPLAPISACTSPARTPSEAVVDAAPPHSSC